MIYLKILGSIFIIASSTLIGFTIGTRYKNRYLNLVQLENCIRLLETEIIYHLNPIPLALENVHLKGNKKVSYIFLEIKELLLANSDINLSDCFREVLKANKDKLDLSHEDVEVLLTLGNVIGVSDRNDQLKHLKSSLVQINSSQKDAEFNMKKNENMYKRLGFLMGILVTLVLL